MRRPLAGIALILVLLPAVLAAVTSAPGPAPASAKRIAEVAAAAEALLAKAYPASEPGAAVLVRWQGKTVLRKGYGSAQMDFGVPVAPGQVFEIGSVTKQFTAALILRLAEQGKLALSDPLTKFLPDLTFGGATITLEELLSHTAGVPNYTDMQDWIPRWREDMTLDVLIGLFKDKPLDFPPGTSWNYSNSGYVLLGAVIERVTGRSYEEVVEKELFAPLGMTATRYGHQEEIVPGRVAGYVRTPEGWANAPYLSLTQPYSAGALLSTVDDLARWSDALEAGKVVSPASRDRMFTAALLHGGDQDGVSTRYGLGNGMTEVAGHLAHEHGGGIHGFLCDLMRIPDADLLVVLLSNNPTQDPNGLAHRIAVAALGGPAPARVAAPAAAALDDYVGVYLVPERAEARRVVTRDGAKLQFQRTGGELNTLEPTGADAFELGDGTGIRFSRDAAGKVDAIFVDNGAGPIFRSRRTAEPIPAPRKEVAVDSHAFAALVGVFTLAPGFEIAVTLEGGHLFAQATGQGKFELYPESPTRFFYKVVDAQIDFLLDGGHATSLVLHQGGRDMAAPKKP